MNSPKTIVPRSESEKLLSLPTREAEQLFQSYGKATAIGDSQRDPQPEGPGANLLPCTRLHGTYSGKPDRGCAPSFGHNARHRSRLSTIALSFKRSI